MRSMLSRLCSFTLMLCFVLTSPSPARALKPTETSEGAGLEELDRAIRSGKPSQVGSAVTRLARTVGLLPESLPAASSVRPELVSSVRPELVEGRTPLHPSPAFSAAGLEEWRDLSSIALRQPHHQRDNYLVIHGFNDSGDRVNVQFLRVSKPAERSGPYKEPKADLRFVVVKGSRTSSSPGNIKAIDPTGLASIRQSLSGTQQQLLKEVWPEGQQMPDLKDPRTQQLFDDPHAQAALAQIRFKPRILPLGKGDHAVLFRNVQSDGRGWRPFAALTATLAKGRSDRNKRVILHPVALQGVRVDRSSRFRSLTIAAGLEEEREMREARLALVAARAAFDAAAKAGASADMLARLEAQFLSAQGRMDSSLERQRYESRLSGGGLEEWESPGAWYPDDPDATQLLNMMFLTIIREGIDRVDFRFERISDEESLLVGDLYTGPEGEEVLRGDLGRLDASSSREFYDSFIRRLKVMAEIERMDSNHRATLSGIFSLDVRDRPVTIDVSIIGQEREAELASLRFRYPEGLPISDEETPAGLEAETELLTEAKKATVGYAVDAGVGLIRSRLQMDTPYLVVAEAREQAEALLDRKVPATRILVLVASAEDEIALINRSENPMPEHHVFRADEFPDWSSALRHVWNVSRLWLETFEAEEAIFLKATARTLPGLLAQLREILPEPWYEQIGEEDVRFALDIYEIGV